MTKLVQLLLIMCLIFPTIVSAEENGESVKVAFVKDDYLWIQSHGQTEKITTKRATYTDSPQWSFDGRMVLYQKEAIEPNNKQADAQNELWVYDVQTKKHRKIFYDGYNPKWSPTENIVAFQSGGVLNISDLKRFYNIALGVSSFEWQPNGKKFIVSSSADLRPDGWTHPILFTISIEEGYQNISNLTKNVKTLFVIPKEIGKEDVKIPSINANSFAFSPSKKWLSFIVSPTASWSMDSNMLCVISVDGKEFTIMDEVILYEFTPKWSFKKDVLGYIAGGGRIVSGFKNKHLKVTEIPGYQAFNLTPENYAEMGFTWVDDTSLIVSRVTESEWSNDPEKRPKPSLYLVSLNNQKQIQITTPPKDKGDYNPIYLPSINKITWVRNNNSMSRNQDLWKSDINGEHAEIWIRNVESYAFFPSI